MIDVTKLYELLVDEDAVAAAPSAPVGGEVVSNGTGMSAHDVLGKDCNHKVDGFMGSKCNHIPKNVLSTSGSKRTKKGKKTPYEKNINIITDSEELTEEELSAFEVLKRHGWNVICQK